MPLLVFLVSMLIEAKHDDTREVLCGAPLLQIIEILFIYLFLFLFLFLVKCEIGLYSSATELYQAHPMSK